jgi:hypothetical protein
MTLIDLPLLWATFNTSYSPLFKKMKLVSNKTILNKLNIKEDLIGEREWTQLHGNKSRTPSCSGRIWWKSPGGCGEELVKVTRPSALANWHLLKLEPYSPWEWQQGSIFFDDYILGMAPGPWERQSWVNEAKK